MVELITNESPYVLDMIKQEDSLPALTRKNSDFIEAVVQLDSNYAKDTQYIEPSESFNPENDYKSIKNKYQGSTKYWFEEMKNPNSDFRKCVLGSIIAIDIINSTHLESSENGRFEMRNRICSRCKNVDELIELLNKPFNPDDEDHLITILTKPIKAKNKSGNRFNISFASKFCAYASKFLNCEIEYSKYDNVVSAALPNYVKIYLNEIVKLSEYKISDKNDDSMDTKLKRRLDIYKKYSIVISKILETLNQDGIEITKEEFDHIVWYGTK